MKTFSALILFLIVFSVSTTQLDVWSEFKAVAVKIHHFEKQAYVLKAQNSHLLAQNSELKAQVLKLKAKNEHLAISSSEKKTFIKRSIASIDQRDPDDLVQFEVYGWEPEKLLDIAEQSFHFKKYEKAAQYFNALFKNYPNFKGINDETYFNSGVASFESFSHYNWAMESFQELLKKYPRSKYARGSKLWLALAYHKTGKAGRFMASVDEFRLKYRNSKEWKVLSRYYEDIAFKYKK